MLNTTVICQNRSNEQDVFTGSTALGVYAGITKSPQRTVRTESDNEGFVLSWILSGTGRFSAKEGEHIINAPCVCIRRPNRRYFLDLNAGEENFRLYLRTSESIYELLCAMNPKLDSIEPVIPFEYDEAVYRQFKWLIKQMQEKPKERYFELSSDFLSLLFKLSKLTPENEKSGLERAKSMLEEPSERRSLEEIAKECGYSISNFRKKFTKAYNISPSRYRIEYRIGLAKEALKAEHSVSAVAEMLSYTDVYTFSHQFSLVTGMSPSDYRKKEVSQHKKGAVR
jgi:AraC-like DNA-binding protein